jgi:hypothetical protein
MRVDWTSTRIVDTPNRQDCPCQKERVSCPQCERLRVNSVSLPSAWLSEGLSIRKATDDLGMPRHTQAHLDRISRRLNGRPRQTLGFNTPAFMINHRVAMPG